MRTDTAPVFGPFSAGLASSAAPAVPQQPAPGFPGGSHYAIGCSISHRNNDDPIVFPGRPGRSHNHTFIGNTTVNAWATPASLRGGPTSCSDPFDSSGYWFPSLFVGQTDFYDERYPTGTLVPAIASGRFTVTGTGSRPGI